MLETPPPLQPPSPPVSNHQFSSQRKLLYGAAIAFAVLLFLALLFFLTQVQRNKRLNDVAVVPERVIANDTENTANTTTRTEKIEETAGGSSSSASAISERQVKQPTRQSHELNNEQELSRFLPTDKEIVNANRFANFGGKVEFFGISTPCEHVSFLIDSSGSMKGRKFDRVREELLKSLRDLKPPQRFSIYLFNDRTVYKRKNCVASPAEIDNIQQGLDRLSADGGTDPTDAIKEAVDEESDVIFLLSDGKIRQSGKDIARLNWRGKIINTIAIGGDSQSLRDVAKENRGEYRNAQ